MGLSAGTPPLTGLSERGPGFDPTLGQFLSWGCKVVGQLSLQFGPCVPREVVRGTQSERILSMKGHGLQTVCWEAWKLQGRISGHPLRWHRRDGEEIRGGGSFNSIAYGPPVYNFLWG